MKKPIILVLCTGNSCRSHMAEGYLKQQVGHLYDVQSAGAKPSGYVHPVAQKVMGEIGIDISQHTSKHLDEFINGEVETVITVCDNAEGCCPAFKGEQNHYCWSFEDPADAVGTPQEIEDEFRRIRDQISEKFELYADELKQQTC